MRKKEIENDMPEIPDNAGLGSPQFDFPPFTSIEQLGHGATPS